MRPVWPGAVLWDMDGTLVDTEPYWMAAEHELVEEYGGTWTHEHALQLVGNDLMVSAAYIKEHGDVPLSEREIVETLLDRVIAQVEVQVPWRPGARELLAALVDAGVPSALVTMSWTRLVDPVVAALPEGSFAAVVTGDRVPRGKPHPEPYLAALAALGVAADDALAIEDSITGAQSAQSAGVHVLVVPCHVEVPGGPGRTLLPSLDGLSLADLAALR